MRLVDPLVLQRGDEKREKLGAPVQFVVSRLMIHSRELTHLWLMYRRD